MTDYTPEELEAQEIIPYWKDPKATRLKEERDELLIKLKDLVAAVHQGGFPHAAEKAACELIAKVEK